MKRLKEGNPDTLITLVNPKKKKMLSTPQNIAGKKKSTGKHTSSASTLNELPNNSSLPSPRPMRHASLTRYPMAHKTYRPLVYNTGWTEEKEE